MLASLTLFYKKKRTTRRLSGKTDDAKDQLRVGGEKHYPCGVKQ